MNRVLYPFQSEGCQYLMSRRGPKGKALLFDDPGLGKTTQAMASLGGEPVIVTCPASVKAVWRDEMAIVRPDYKVVVLYGKGSFVWPKPGEMVVLNPELLPNTDKFTWTCPMNLTLIADEAQMYKTFSAIRTKSFSKIRKSCLAFNGRVIGLTGTPIMSEPDDLWGILRAMDAHKDVYGTREHFDYLFQKRTIATGFGFKTTWGNPLPEAAQRLAAFALGRRKRDVLRDLPEKTYEVLPIAIAKEGAGYLPDIPEADLEIMLRERDERISTARKELAIRKVASVKSHILECAEQAPVVVFSYHKAAVEAFQGEKGWQVITGGTPSQERDEYIRLFQDGKLKGLAGTIGALSTGITLTRSSHAFFIDRSYQPSENLQAEDRLLRIGQKNAVLITDVVSDVPLDGRVHKILLSKQRIIDASVEKARV